MKRRRGGDGGAGPGGFILLEVLVGLVLIGLALTVTFRAGSTAIGATTRSADAIRATLHARSLLAAYGVSRPLRPGSEDGRADPSTTWRAEIAERPSPSPLVRAFDISLHVTSGGHTSRLATTRLVPVAPEGRP